MSAAHSSPMVSSSPAGAPLHVAIIMDGNRRWAKQRRMPRPLGYRAGVEALRRTVEAAPDLGVRTLTVFGFSTENWSRPASDVSDLMELLKLYVRTDLDRLRSEGVRVKVVGRRTGLKPDILEVIHRAESRTAENDDFLLQVAFNYGGRADIADAARRIAEAVQRGEIDADRIDEEVFGQQLSTTGLSPDLVIRTSGEQRLSNFLLWEGAYAELVFQDVLWPDFGPAHLKAAIDEFYTRERRYGGAVADDVLAAG